MKKNVIEISRGEKWNGGEKMFIGEILKERMDCFNMTVDQLAEAAIVEESEILSILDNKQSLSEIDELSLEFISQVLHCKPEYFGNEGIRRKDLVNSCKNRGLSTSKSNQVKGILQDFVDDLEFLLEVKEEM